MIDIIRYLMAMLVAAIAAVVGFTNATFSIYGATRHHNNDGYVSDPFNGDCSGNTRC